MCLDPVTAAVAYGASQLGEDKGGDTTTNNYTAPSVTQPTETTVDTVSEAPKKTSNESSLKIPKKDTTTPKKQSLQTPKTINY